MRRFVWLIPVLLAAAVYLPALWGQQVWDDPIIAEQISSFRSARDLFVPPAHIPQWPGAYYRPVWVLSLAIDFGLHGHDATLGPHLSNIVFHMLTTFFVWLLARQVLRGLPLAPWGAVVAAAVFAVHPIHTESVSWIAGRTDTLAAMFAVPSLVLAVAYRDTKSRLALLGAPLLYLLALMAKEVAIATLALVPVMLALVPRPQRPAPAADGTIWPGRCDARTWLWLGTAFTGATLLYFFLRHLGGTAFGGETAVSWSQMPPRLLRAGGYYLLKVVFPPPQSHVVMMHMTPRAAMAALIIIAAAALGGIGIWQWRRRGETVLLVSLLWLGLTLAPSLATAVRVMSETPVAERYLYLPSVGLALILGMLFCRVAANRRGQIVATTIVVLLIGLAGAATIARGIVWTNGVRLWDDAARKSPQDGLTWLNLGLAYYKAGKEDQALACYDKALGARYDNEGRAKAYNNRAIIHATRGDVDQAHRDYQAAIREVPTYAKPYYGAGMLHLTRVMRLVEGSPSADRVQPLVEKAIHSIGRALKLNPDYLKARRGMSIARLYAGNCYELTGDANEAVRQYRLALRELDALREHDASFGGMSPAPEEIRANAERRLSLLGASAGSE